MKHLILGSSGLIGGYLADYLINHGEEVIEFDIIRKDEEDLRNYSNANLLDMIGICDFVHFLAFDVGGSTYLQKYQKSHRFLSNNIKIMNTVFDCNKGKPQTFHICFKPDV